MPLRSDRKYTVSPIHIGALVVAVGPRQLFDGAIGEVDQPDRTRAPAAIVAPQAALVLRPVGREAEPDLLVGDATAVRRDSSR